MVEKFQAWYIDGKNRDDYFGYDLYKKSDGSLVKVSNVFSTIKYEGDCRWVNRSEEETYRVGCEWANEVSGAIYVGLFEAKDFVSKVKGLMK